MSSTNFEETNLTLAENYYKALIAKDFDQMASYLHENVHFIGPLSLLEGKEAVIVAAKNLSQILQEINIRARFSKGEQIMLAYDFIFPDPIGLLRASVLMTFDSSLISKIELFYDGRPFAEREAPIFQNPQE